MPIDRDITTDPDVIERQYRAGRNQAALNIEMAELGSIGMPSAIVAPLFGGTFGAPYINPITVTTPPPLESIEEQVGRRKGSPII